MTESRTVHDDLTRKMFRKFKKLTCKILERSCHVPACRLDARGWPQGGGSLDRGHAFVHQHGRHHRPHRVGLQSGRQTYETLQKSVKKGVNLVIIFGTVFCFVFRRLLQLKEYETDPQFLQLSQDLTINSSVYLRVLYKLRT